MSNSLDERIETRVNAGEEGHSFDESHLDGSVTRVGRKVDIDDELVGSVKRHFNIRIKLLCTHIPANNSKPIFIRLWQSVICVENNC